jgi:uncharacterized protein DUF7025
MADSLANPSTLLSPETVRTSTISVTPGSQSSVNNNSPGEPRAVCTSLSPENTDGKMREPVEETSGQLNEIRKLQAMVFELQKQVHGRTRLHHDGNDSGHTSDSSVASSDFEYRETLIRAKFERDIDKLRKKRRQHQRQKERKMRREHEDLESQQARPELDQEGRQNRNEGATGHQEASSSPSAGLSHVVPQMNFVEWDQFKNLHGHKGAEKGDSFAIDILIGEPVLDFKLPSWFSKSRPTTKHSPAAGRLPLPERIRINSKQLLRILAEIHGSDLCSKDESVVIIRPFKALVYYHNSLLNWYDKLKKKIDSTLLNRSAMTDSIDDAGESNWDDDTSSPTVLGHLQCLLEFMDSTILSRIKYLESASCEKVFFIDIWYLFKPGEEVVTSDIRQVYRVIQVTSPAHRVRDSWWRVQSADKSEELCITIECVYIDFDGKTLGPVCKVFEITTFDGEKAVTSLPIYPLRFVQSGYPGQSNDVIREKMVYRGKKFLDVAAVKAMHYAGLTLDTKESVNDQVVIDFEAAFAAEDRSHWIPCIEQLLSTEHKKREEESCSALCCRGENVHDDTYVEEKRGEEYRASLIPDSPHMLPSVAIYPLSIDEVMTRGATDDELIIMTYRVFGFILRSQKWGELSC